MEPDPPNLSLNNFVEWFQLCVVIYLAPIVGHNLEANGGGESPFQYQSKAINLPERLSQGEGINSP